MRRIFPSRILTAALGALFLAVVPGNSQAPRERQLFDSGWRFHLGDVNQGQSTSLADKDWRQVDLPHDWSIEGPYSTKNASGTAFLPGGIAWYRKTFQLPVSMRGRKVSIRFDGVYRDSTVWINGVLLGSRPYGYSTFEYDLTPHLHLGDVPNVAGGARGPQRRCRLAMVSRVGDLSPRLAQRHRPGPHRALGTLHHDAACRGRGGAGVD